VVGSNADTDDGKDALIFLPISSSMRTATCGPDDDGTGRIRRSVPMSDDKLNGTCGNRVDDCRLFFHHPLSLLLSRRVRRLLRKASMRHAAWRARRIEGSPAKNGQAVDRGFLLSPIVARVPVIQYSCLVNGNLAWHPAGSDAHVPLAPNEGGPCMCHLTQRAMVALVS
jgi:hypothetical protein